jgi:hypothetical protein
METAKAGIGATGLTEVFSGQTNSAGQLVLADLSKIIAISTDWVTYQASNAKYFSPRVLLFITYSNATGSFFFEQDSIPLITLDFLSHESATVNHVMDLGRPIRNVKLNTQVNKLNTQVKSATLNNILSFSSPPPPMTLPSPPATGLTYWVYDHTDGPYPSSCCGNIPIAWAHVLGGAYASMSVNLVAAGQDDLNTGYATGQGSSMSGPTYYSGNAISSFQNQASFAQTVNLNLCTSYCSPSTGEIWINGQFEGDQFELFACCDINGYPIDQGQAAYEIGIVNVPISNGNIQGGWDYNLPSYTSYTAFGQDFHSAQVGGLASGTGNPTPQQQLTSYTVTANFVGNQIQWYANLALTGLSLVPLLPAQVASNLGGIINNLVGPIGSQNVNQWSSWIQYDAPVGQQVYAMTSVSNTQWQVSGMSAPGYAPIEGYYAYANPTLSCSAGASPSDGTRTVTVQFSASCSGGVPPYSYNWQFGDGGSSTAQNPTHTYYYRSPTPPDPSVYYPSLGVHDSTIGTSNPGVPTIYVYCGTPCAQSPSP